jgi:hypothetical protein
MANPPPQSTVMQMMMASWTAQTIATIARLGVADLLQRHGPLTGGELVERHGVGAKAVMLERALRACASVGIFSESADGRFGPTALSAVLVEDAPGSIRSFVELIGGPWWELFSKLEDTLRTGEPVSSPFEGDRPGTERFGKAMRSRVESTRGTVEHADLSGSRAIVDVGGSLGHLAIALLERHPHLTAAVLDLPEVIEVAERQATGLAPAIRSRLSFVAGDMFVDVPAADTYFVKTVMHDWDDARCVRLLVNCRRRLVDGGRVYGVDNVLPPMGDTGASGTKFLDMLMMLSLPGRERTEAEWRALYAEAGLEMAEIVPINPRSVECIIEGRPRAIST